ncbi:MAG: glycosyltransferase family 2 protein [Patescibacteria group bacterium]
MNITAVIPAYNEAASIARVVAQVKPRVGEVIVVDDGSTDDTSVAAAAAGAYVLKHLINRGYGAALITGTNSAFKRGADIAVHFDADGQFAANELNTVIAPVAAGEADIVFGSRFLGRVEGISALRYVTLKLAIYFTWFMSGLKLTDAHNGFRAVSRAAWQDMNLRQSRMAFSSEIMDETARHNLRYREVPVTVKYTEYSRRRSQQGKWPALKIVKDIFWSKFLS